MARRETAARRYAEAAFELARADKSLDAWGADLARLSEALASPQVEAVVRHPAIAFERKQELLRRVVGDGVSPQALNLVLLMIRRGRPKQVPAMVERFNELLRRERGVVRAEVRSALPLEDAEREAISERLRALTGDAVEINELVDPSLIGGIAVRIGDRLYDASVRSRLERLRARLTA
jgi:F-type H+-transporting ATPase subunit delta